MKRLTCAIAMVAALAPLPSSAATRTESQPYTAGGSIVYFCGGRHELANVNDRTVEGDTPNLGGGCFTVRPDDTAVNISILNDVGGPASGTYAFAPNPNGRRQLVRFCGSSSTVVIPSWADSLTVHPDTTSAGIEIQNLNVGVLGGCSEPASLAASGTISVRFS